MGVFYIGCKIENHVHRAKSARVAKVLVDTDSEHTWIAESTLRRIGIKAEKKDVAFLMANGQTVTRNVGFGVLRVADSFTIDEVVFAQKGDQQLLGARTLEGLNLRVDTRQKKLVAAGPYPAA